MVRRGQRGAGNVGCVIGLVILVAAIIVGMKAIPAKIKVSEFQDFCVRQAESASLPRFTNKAINDQILVKSHQLGLRVPEENLKVWRDTSQVHIEVKYTVVIEFPFYTYNWDVEHKVDRVLF